MNLVAIVWATYEPHYVDRREEHFLAIQLSVKNMVFFKLMNKYTDNYGGSADC